MHYLEKELYQKVQKDESFFKFIQGTSSGGLWYWDVENPQHVWISERFWEVLGYEASTEETKEMYWEQLIHGGDLSNFQQQVDNYLGKKIETLDVVVRCITHGDKIVWMHGKGRSFHNTKGKPNRLLVTYSDVTKLKNAEVEAKRLSQRYAHIIEGANIGTWEWNAQTGEIIFNERWADIIGYTLAEISPVSFQTWVDFSHPEDLQKAIDKLQQHIRGDTPFYESDVRMKHKEGHWIHVYTRGKVATHTHDGQAEWVSGYHLDISERKQLEVERQAYEGRKLKAIIESMNDLVIILDRNLIFLEYHLPSSISLLTEPENFIGKHFDAIGFPEPAHQIVKNVLQEVISTNTSGNVEYALEMPDGLKWFDAQIHPMHAINGDIINVVCTIRDITERKLAEEEIKESEQRFRRLFEEVESVAVQGFLQDGTTIFWNKASEQLYGYTAEEAIGRKVTDLIIPEESKQEVETDISMMCETGISKSPGELRLKNKYGKTVEIFANHLVLQRLNAPTEVFGIDVDVTERNRAIRQLRNSEQRFRLFAEMAPVGIVISDPEEAPEYISKKFTEITGYTREDLPNIEAWWTAAYPNDEIKQKVRKVWSETMAEARRSRKESPLLSHPIVCKDGSKKYVEFRISTTDEFNFVVVTDVTYRELAQKEQRQLQAELEKSNNDLAHTNSELEQFAYIASHDLQEPLRMVSSFVSLLEKKYSHLLDEKGKQYVHFAVDGAARMRQMIVDLLEYSRVGRFVSPDEEVDFNELTAEVLHIYAQEIEAKKAIVSVDSLPSLVIEKAPMRQVMQNLISNALKYTFADRRPEISIFVEEGKKFWKFAVADNGIGIAPEYSEKVFAIFQRLHDRTVYQGNGLGLAITKKIIENKGGKIWFTSTENVGTTFWFSLPK